MLDEAVSSSMSPRPIRRSAPGWSRMTRESASDETEKAIREGMFALITPVMTSTEGRWVARTRWMPTARAIWAIRQTDSSTSRAATIIRSFSSSTTMRMNGSLWWRLRSVGSGISASSTAASTATSGLVEGALGEVAPVDRLVVAGDVADADLGEEVVAAFHLGRRSRRARWRRSSG